MAWSVLALAVLWPVSIWLDGSFPLFTMVWISIPLVAVTISKDAGRAGFRSISLRDLIHFTVLCLGGSALLMILLEPWSHTYRMLLQAAVSQPHPDTTFAWLVRLPRAPATGAMILYSGTVTLFGEELFFRGWLLRLLRNHLPTPWAILLQALLFTLPNLLVTLVLPPLQGILYAVLYTFLGIGLIGGWAAARTASIWPSLISATILNAGLVLLLM